MKIQQFRFSQDNQYSSLVYTLQPGEQILRFDHNMLVNNNINGILNYSVGSDTNGISLTYTILRGTRLSLLKNRTLSGQYVIAVLLGIANILITSEQYMLKEKLFVLSEDCIFIDTGTGAVNLIYIPTNGYSGISFAQFVRFFVTNGLFDYGEEAGRIMSLLNFIHTNPNASSQAVKSFLERSAVNSGKANAAVQTAPSIPVAQQWPVQQSTPQLVPVVQPNIVQSVQESNSTEKKGFFSKMFGNRKAKSESVPSGIMAGMNIPGMQHPTALLVQPAHEKKKGFRKDTTYVTAANVSPAPVLVPSVSNRAFPEMVSEANSKSNKMVLLNSGNYSGNKQRAYLIGTNGERVAIAASGFTVGNENTSGVSNDYIINNSSVSRNHAMFEIINGRYYIVDMTSLNGTFVNGSRINSNVRIEVKNGDRVVFANAEYRFVIE